LPQLPSGRMVGLSRECIVEPGAIRARCPEGHFWLETPDLSVHAPPFAREGEILRHVVHAPLPKSPAEMARYIEVIENIAESRGRPTGVRFDCTVRPPDWSEEDWRAFEDWKRDESARIEAFLEEALELCREQVEANSADTTAGASADVAADAAADAAAVVAVDVAVDASTEVGADDDGTSCEPPQVPPEIRQYLAKRRATRLGDEVGRLEGRIAQGIECEEERARILGRLHAIEDVVRELLVGSKLSLVEGWCTFACVARLLGRLDAAESAMLTALDMEPDSIAGWLELVRIRFDRKDFVGAESAARRAVEIRPGFAPSLAILAHALARLGRREEARAVLREAQQVDEEGLIDADDWAAIDGEERSEPSDRA
jgi:tetratricopeptide (TPR) repeat protein